MKKMFRKTAGLLIVLLLLSVMLTACRGKNVVGTYQASYNMRDVLNRDLEAAGTKLESDIFAGFVLELRDDGTFAFDLDGAGFRDRYTEAIRAEGRGIIEAMLEEQGITEDMHDMVASAGGYESYDAYVDGMIDMILDEMNDQSIQELETSMHTEGTYSVKKNRLVLTGGTDGEKGIKEGTIGEDSSILLASVMDDGTTIDLLFVKQE